MNDVMERKFVQTFWIAIVSSINEDGSAASFDQVNP